MAGPIVTVEVPNLLAVQARLEELGTVKVPLAMRKILVAGAKPVRAAIRSQTPVGSPSVNSLSFPGDLQRGVRYKAGKTTRSLAAAAGVSSAISYYIIGPFGKGTAHRHLVIGGHEIVGHKPNLTRTGKRTRPNAFVQRGRDAAAAPALAAVASAAGAAVEAAAAL